MRVDNPTVSVVIPCYNAEATIGKTLTSVRRQTFVDWEAIVVNDGSTDNSVEIIRRHAEEDTRVRRINPQGKGKSLAVNAGIGVASGRFINLLCADDTLLPNMLEVMVQKLEKDPSVGAVHCGWIWSDPQMKDLTWIRKPPKHKGQIFEEMAHIPLFPIHSVLFQSEVLQNVDVLDSSLKHCEDWDLWLRMGRAGVRFGRVCEPLVICRMLPNSSSRNPVESWEDGLEVIKRAHAPDPRVKQSDPRFAQGCACSMKEPILRWLLTCVARAIAKGDTDQAVQLLETGIEEYNLKITVNEMGLMRNHLWYAAAVPPGNWEKLWPSISRSLLQFLLRAEERLATPGFAMQCLLEIIGWHKPMPGRELISALRKKITQRIFRI